MTILISLHSQDSVVLFNCKWTKQEGLTAEPLRLRDGVMIT